MIVYSEYLSSSNSCHMDCKVQNTHYLAYYRKKLPTLICSINMVYYINCFVDVKSTLHH